MFLFLPILWERKHCAVHLRWPAAMFPFVFLLRCAQIFDINRETMFFPPGRFPKVPTWLLLCIWCSTDRGASDGTSLGEIYLQIILKQAKQVLKKNFFIFTHFHTKKQLAIWEIHVDTMACSPNRYLLYLQRRCVVIGEFQDGFCPPYKKYWMNDRQRMYTLRLCSINLASALALWD
jgi:hypothetical protein